MTDDAEQYYTAWRTTFGGEPTKILCLWHVERAWKAAVVKYIKDEEVQCQVYLGLRILMEETDIPTFENLLVVFLNQLQLSDGIEEFANYIYRYHQQCKTQWAISY
jgi:hypothetical protein